MHATETAALDGQIARLCGAGTDHRRIEVLEQHLCLDVLADRRITDELDAFFFQQPDTALDDSALVELHVGDAIHQQAARAVVAFKYRDQMTGAVQLRSGGEAGWPRAHHHHFLAGAGLRRFGNHPAFLEAAVDDRCFQVLDGHRRAGNAEYAGAFAGRRADAPGEVGKVVGLVQPDQRFLPEAAVDQVVPLRYQVVDRTADRGALDGRAVMAEGHTTVHAARTLLAQPLLVHVVMELVPVANPFARGPVYRQFAYELDESSWLAHVSCHLRATDPARFLQTPP